MACVSKDEAPTNPLTYSCTPREPFGGLPRPIPEPIPCIGDFNEDRVAALPGLVPGALGGAVPGISAGIVWAEIFKASNFEGYSGMLVSFTFMPPGAATGAFGGALTFGLIAFRDAEIALGREPRRSRNR